MQNAVASQLQPQRVACCIRFHRVTARPLLACSTFETKGRVIAGGGCRAPVGIGGDVVQFGTYEQMFGRK